MGRSPRTSLALSTVSSLLMIFAFVTLIDPSSRSRSLITTVQANPQVLRYLELGNIDAAYDLLHDSFWKSERNPDPAQVEQPLSQRKIRRGGGMTITSQYKLEADLEQAKHLATHVLPERDPKKAEYFRSVVIPTYEKVLARVPPLDELPEASQGLYQFQEADIADGILNIYNKCLYQPTVDEFDNSTRTKIKILSDSFDADTIQDQWAKDGIVVIDDLLSKEALNRIRKVLEESTIFYQTKLPKSFGGYSGAYIDDGLYQRIILALAVELRKRFPKILKNHPLKYLWAYKYSSDYRGIKLHADEASVNLNIWITPEDANLDKESGGLVIFTVKPPEDWDINQYNRDTEVVYEELLKPSKFANVTVPYRENRAVMFDSALFHQTDEFSFKTGYQNRRINLTILYGDMQRTKHPNQATAKAEL